VKVAEALIKTVPYISATIHHVSFVGKYNTLYFYHTKGKCTPATKYRSHVQVMTGFSYAPSGISLSSSSRASNSLKINQKATPAMRARTAIEP